MSIRGQGHYLSFDPGLSYFDDLKYLLKATGPTVTKFHIWPLRVERASESGANENLSKRSR